MKFLNKMERKLGKYAIPNLTLVIIGCFVFGYIAEIIAPGMYLKLSLLPYNILYKGEWWRVFTWIFTPPFALNVFTILGLFFYYSVGRQLEMTWGKFMYNIYIFGGMFLITAGVLIAFYMRYRLNMGDVLYLGLNTTYYLVFSMFLALAVIYPDSIIMLLFIIPVKIKWIAYADLIYLAYRFLREDSCTKVVIVMCIMNFLIFYIINSRRSGMSIKQKKRQFDYRRKVRQGRTANHSAGTFNRTGRADRRYRGSVLTGEVESNTQTKKINYGGVTRHKCAICGRTENDSDELEFRFCSKCNGNYEYCNEHLFTHEHVK